MFFFRKHHFSAYTRYFCILCHSHGEVNGYPKTKAVVHIQVHFFPPPRLAHSSAINMRSSGRVSSVTSWTQFSTVCTSGIW